MKHRETALSSVIKTLLYASLFDAGVRLVDLERFLIGATVFSPNALKKSISFLVAKKTIHAQSGWIYVGKKDRVKSLIQKWQWSKQKKSLLFSYLPWVVWIPTISGIAITGSVAVGNAQVGEDIDLMIVTKTGFLWATRLLVEGIFYLRGCLRTRGMKKVRNKLCLNLWLDESALSFSQHSLYIAREMAQAVWVVDRHAVRRTMFASNSWARQFIASTYAQMSKVKRRQDSELNSGLLYRVFSPLEWLAYLGQTLRMRDRTREVVTLRAAFFHPRDTKRHVEDEFKSLCKKYKIT